MFFNEIPFQPIFVYPVLSDPKKHWSQNRVSFVYFSDLESEAVINFHHNDAVICLRIDDLRWSDTLYAFPMIVDPGPLHEATGVLSSEMLYWFSTGTKLKLNTDRSVTSYWSMGIENINDAIPIMRWIGYCRTIRDSVIKLGRSMSGLAEYNRFSFNLRKLEQSGLRSVKNKIEYTQYDPYTTTGRPSNHFDGINYAALTTSDRANYTTRFVNGFLINVDFRGFHLFLLHSILGLEFPGDIYNSLHKIYADAGIDVNEPKSFTFRQIYGGVDPRLVSITPFKEINDLSMLLFDLYIGGNLTTLLHGKPVQFQTGLSRWKLLNYMLQNLETEFNMGLIDSLVNANLRSKLILYTYDSFLFDVHPDELKSFAEQIKEVFSEVPYKIQIGRDYGNMRTIHL